ncbi:hypothetical protein SAMN04488499_103757 [Sporomusa acidovorans]|nr:hypothetical protein SAMN04488499_103757 [Sporomusa acidovorans]
MSSVLLPAVTDLDYEYGRYTGDEEHIFFLSVISIELA